MLSLLKVRIFVLLIVAVFVIISGCVGDIFNSQTEYPVIDIDSAPGDYGSITHSFLFEDNEIKLVIPVDKGIYRAAYNSDKSAYLSEDDLLLDNWSSEYYRSFIFDPSQELLYESILGEFRILKDDLSLDSDRYAELIIAYVQSIPYKTDSIRTEPKFTIETVYENSGDCDDKSLLAAALLSREGYNVVLFEFKKEEHMAVGIKSSGCFFKNTGYSYMEVTGPNYLGWPLIEVNENLLIESEPYVVLIDGGATRYNSCSQVLSIYAAMTDSEENAKNLETDISEKKKELEIIYDEIGSLSERMKNLKNNGDIFNYNRLVPKYNSKISEYNLKNEALKSLTNRYNRYVEIYNYIIEHRYDRKGVYEYINKNPVV